MGHQAIIYGRIQEDREGTAARWPVAPEYNRAVLQGLPDTDSDGPCLTRHMFGVTPRPFHGDVDRSGYRGYVIHFGASTKDGPDEPNWPEQFLAKLESLVLKRLLWLSARVHFESTFFPERVFLYTVEPESLGDLYRELGEVRFGTKVESEVRWERREFAGIGCRPSWLR